MAGLFRSRQPFLQTNSWQNQALNALHYNTSQVGSVVPLIYGTTRQQVNLVNFANYIGPAGKKGKSGSLPVTGTSNTGKGGGSSKGKGSKKTGGDYSIDVDFIICQGPVTFNGNNYVFSSTGVEPFNSSGLNFYTGADGQANDPTFDSLGFPVNYSGSCRVTGTPMDLGQSPVIPNLSFEITGFLAGVDTGAGYPFDANPANIITDFLTNPRYGAGFPAVNLDNLIGGSGLAYGDYCQAAQLLVSISLDGHQTAIEWLAPLVKLTNSALVWSGKLLKIIPYGDLALSSNGATWTPNLTPLYSLTDDDFLPWRARQLGRGPNPGEDDPILTSITNAADVYNWLPIEYTDRSNFYNSTIISAFDQSLIDQYNLRMGDSIQGRAFSNATSAQISAQLQLQRNVYFRTTPIKFQGGWQYALVEPMDILLLTGQFGDDYLQDTPVRILSVTENENGDLSFEAEEIQVGQNAPAPNPSPPTAPAPPEFEEGSAKGALGPTSLALDPLTTTSANYVLVFVTALQTALTENPRAPAPVFVGTPTSPNLSFSGLYQYFPDAGAFGSGLPNSYSAHPPNFGSVYAFVAHPTGPLTGEVVTIPFSYPYPSAVVAGIVAVKGATGFDGTPNYNQDLTGGSSTLQPSGFVTSRPDDLIFSWTSSWSPGPPLGTFLAPWQHSGIANSAAQPFDGIAIAGTFACFPITSIQTITDPMVSSTSNWSTVTYALTAD